ncbi:MAG: hypothetical protein N3B10_04895 [Armatimonadetes bacterium]|nr:hypothetical protein [Armatimonadota bacterium]MCX7967813.1 hypothetical protein [Armatimonadota bacterium]MDW8142794.1 hypothetical protein [Armatimonadota bacterium]
MASNRSVLFKPCFVFCAISHIFRGQPRNAFNTSIAFLKALIASFMRLIEIRLLRGICSRFPSALRGELGQTRDCSASMFCEMRKLSCRGLRSCDGLRILFLRHGVGEGLTRHSKIKILRAQSAQLRELHDFTVIVLRQYITEHKGGVKGFGEGQLSP